MILDIEARKIRIPLKNFLVHLVIVRVCHLLPPFVWVLRHQIKGAGAFEAPSQTKEGVLNK